MLFFFCILILVESQQSFDSDFTVKSFIGIEVILILIEILDYIWVYIVWLAGLLVKIYALTFFLGIYYLGGLILIYIDSVFIDWVHFETTFFKLNILEALMHCVFFIYQKNFFFRRGLHNGIVLSVLLWNGLFTYFSYLLHFGKLLIIVFILIWKISFFFHITVLSGILNLLVFCTEIMNLIRKNIILLYRNISLSLNAIDVLILIGKIMFTVQCLLLSIGNLSLNVVKRRVLLMEFIFINFR